MSEFGAWMSRIAVVTSETRLVGLLGSSSASRGRAAVIAPPVSWITVAPIGLLIVPFRITFEALSSRICTSVGATVRLSAKVSGTFLPFRSTSGFTVVLTTSMLLISSGLLERFVISTCRKVSLKSQVPPLPLIDTRPEPDASPLSSK